MNKHTYVHVFIHVSIYNIHKNTYALNKYALHKICKNICVCVSEHLHAPHAFNAPMMPQFLPDRLIVLTMPGLMLHL